MAKPQVLKKDYESLFLCPMEAPQKTVDAFLEKIKTTVTQNEGTLHGIQVWGRRRLAYPIKRHRDGVYIYFDFNGGSSSTNAVNALLRLSDLVLRHILVKKIEIPEMTRPKPRSSTPPSERQGEGNPSPISRAPSPKKEA